MVFPPSHLNALLLTARKLNLKKKISKKGIFRILNPQTMLIQKEHFLDRMTGLIGLTSKNVFKSSCPSCQYTFPLFDKWVELGKLKEERKSP
jgi:thiol-disulfide isomerase/thioredoxin